MNLRNKIKMARDALGWNQKDLSNYSGVSTATIGKFESGSQIPRQTTLDNMIGALERAGVVFLDDGVRLPAISTKKLDGEDWFLNVLDDIPPHLKDNKEKELLLYGSNHKLSPPEVINRFRKILLSNISMRELIEEGNTYIHGDESSYRWISSKNFVNYLTIIYGNKVVLDFGDNSGLMIIDPEYAEYERSKFNEIWDSKPPLSIKSTASERY